MEKQNLLIRQKDEPLISEKAKLKDKLEHMEYELK